MKIYSGYMVQFSMYGLVPFWSSMFSTCLMLACMHSICMFSGTYAHVFIVYSAISFVTVRTQSHYLLATLLSLTCVCVLLKVGWFGGWVEPELPRIISLPGSDFRARIFECRISDLSCTYIHTCLMPLTWTHSYNNN